MEPIKMYLTRTTDGDIDPPMEVDVFGFTQVTLGRDHTQTNAIIGLPNGSLYVCPISYLKYKL